MFERFKRGSGDQGADQGADDGEPGAVATSQRERPDYEDVEWTDAPRSRSAPGDAAETDDRTTGAGAGGATGTDDRTAAAGDADATRTDDRTMVAGDGGSTRTDDGMTGDGGATRTDDRTWASDDDDATRSGDRRAMAAGAGAAAGAGSTQRDERSSEGDATRTDDRFSRDDWSDTGERSAAAERASQREAARRGALTSDAMKTARARQRDEFGGINWGSSFFGWLVAVGIAALITGLLAAAGAAVGLTSQDATVDSIGVGGGIALLAALMLAYCCGGYVAGRMSRFDGARQGAGVWVIALVVTVALALLAVIAGDDYNVLAQLNLPSVPVGESQLRSGGWIVLIAVLVGTLLAAVVGGKAGERYHKRVDRAAFVD